MGSATSFDLLVGLLTMSIVIRLTWLYVLYILLRTMYNISPLHPLYQFPGPKLAAATLWYEGWYDMILTGQYTKQIAKMHDIYGTNTKL